MQTLQQQRAKYALKSVTDLVPLNEGDKLKARASELPFMIHANGLRSIDRRGRGSPRTSLA